MRSANQRVLSSNRSPAGDRSTDINYQYQSRKYQNIIHTQNEIKIKLGKGFGSIQVAGCIKRYEGEVRKGGNAGDERKERKRGIRSGKQGRDYFLYYLHPLLRTRGRHPLSSCLLYR